MSRVGDGSPEALGVSVAGDGINVSVHAPDADAVAICLFDADDRETDRFRLPARTGPVVHGHIAGVAEGARYGLRAYGPWDPKAGHRFNPAKLLMDPWATVIDRPFSLHPLLFDRDSPRPDDTAALMPKALVNTIVERPVSRRPVWDWNRQVIFELHVRGFTMTHPKVPSALRGTFAGLGHPASIRHLTRLGVTAVELMPCAAWIDERHLPPLNLSDYWGYNPIAFLAPDPRLAPGGWAEVRAAVDALHDAGISVILDVVLNHSGESDELGPTVSLRGLDNVGYYRLAEDKSQYVNDAGCGNILAMDRPATVRLALDALRVWARFGGLDGFRLDLASTLGRRAPGFDKDAPLFIALEQDPVLSRCVMIAEPWDIGPGGYQLGKFPARWGEWNDQYRNAVRRFWRRDAGTLGAFTSAFAGSAEIFPGRPLSRSINYVTAHDGFTLADCVSFEGKQNLANGEDNRDGSDDNHSWNNGVEGASTELPIVSARGRDVRALLATLLLSRGTPMLSMGDELGRTQHGNNNAYAQDNAGSWVNWATADDALIDYTAALIKLRLSLPQLFNDRRLTGLPTACESVPDVMWQTPQGLAMTEADWNRESNQTMIAVLFAHGQRAALIFNADAASVGFVLPTVRSGYEWRCRLNSSVAASQFDVGPRSVTVFVEEAERADGKRVAPIQSSTGRLTSGTTDAELDALADLAGIEPTWWDVAGVYHTVNPETKRSLLAAMQLPGATQDDARQSRAQLTRVAALPAVVTARALDPVHVKLGLPRPAWLTLLREDGSTERFHVESAILVLPPQPLGRHQILNEDQPDQSCHLIVAPFACYLPQSLIARERRFGIAAHLYSLRSDGDQGIGDFTTLGKFASEAARAGSSLIGLNPLHALFPHDRGRTSPYQPSDRRFLDPIYIDVARFPGGSEICSPTGPVNYTAVWNAKRKILRSEFDTCTTQEIPAELLQFAIFEAIAERQGSSDWQQWPTELRHPYGSGISAFAAEHQDEVGFQAFLQRIAEEQLRDAAEAGKRSGLSLGLYRDLAVGSAPDGAEAWARQDLLMPKVSIGAPPDPFSAEGQIWSLPPPNPHTMPIGGYAAFSELIVANMQHAGALRIDHVLGLRRLYVVPEGALGVAGAYIRYPFSDLIAQVALQSHRSRCIVVGEDLGTVPEGLTEALAAAGVLSYSVLWFEQNDGRTRPPDDWRRLAAACVSTHDLPTLRGWWEGRDIVEKRSLGLLTDAHAEQLRLDEKRDLIALLQQQNFLTENLDPYQPMPPVFAVAVHAFISATPSLLALVQADDLAGEAVAVNLPGTDKERPNWQRRLDVGVSELCETPLARAILGALGQRVASENR